VPPPTRTRVPPASRHPPAPPPRRRRSAYVRRTAVLGVLKLAKLKAELARDSGVVDTVKALLTSDPDSLVISNCLTVLQAIPGCAPRANKSLVYALLNRIHDFSEWSQCMVLEFVAQYVPESEAEVFDILNTLEDRMQVSPGRAARAAPAIRRPPGGGGPRAAQGGPLATPPAQRWPPKHGPPPLPCPAPRSTRPPRLSSRRPRSSSSTRCPW